MSYTDISMFDPRLVEYLQKKRYCLKNNIIPTIPLETEYAITYDDIQKIKRYLLNHKQTSIPPSGETDKFPIYPPNIQYKNKLHHEHIEKCDSNDNLKHSPDSSKVMRYAEENTYPPAFLYHMVRPNASGRVYDDSNPNDCINTIREQYLSNKPLDQTIKNELILGMPSHASKSYGYNDVFEHSLDYIDGDIQEPNHVVLPFPRGGIPSRLENKRKVIRNVDEIQ